MVNNKHWLLGVDAGTTGLKSLAFDLNGKTLSQAYREYGLSHPDPCRAEQDPEDWWRALTETIREVLSSDGLLIGNLAGLSISSQGSTFVLMGQDNAPICPAISWLDRRSSGLVNFGALTDDELLLTTGLRAYPGWTGSVLRWIRLHEPSLLRRTRYCLLVSDYLIFRLTGAVATDYSSASRTRMFDLSRRRWSPEILAALEIRENQMPPPGPSGAKAGRVTHEAAYATGLMEGTPVMLGGFDQSCMALGAGTITPDALMVSLGTATMAQLCSPSPVADPLGRVSTSCHALPNMHMLQAPINTTGASLRWWRDNCYPSSEEDIYGGMDRLAAEAPIGADGVIMLPHLSGGAAPHWDSGMRAAITGLSLSHTQGHIIRAIMEGVAMEIALNTAVMESMGFVINSVHIVGGGARSNLWRSIIADVLGKPGIRVKEFEVGALGAAMLAGAGAGIFTDIRDAVQSMASIGEPEDYDSDNHIAYNQIRARYNDMLERLYGPNIIARSAIEWSVSTGA